MIGDVLAGSVMIGDFVAAGDMIESGGRCC